ncbi:hypothetical protein CP532_0597 [Ophiocordyceps camponoti-leonardi (nom. inval.)]|nr:hypothetical protein CP532_0597 [Ophiocordyceps camponoti-leonardi (nom. inval.)]
MARDRTVTETVKDDESDASYPSGDGAASDESYTPKGKARNSKKRPSSDKSFDAVTSNKRGGKSAARRTTNPGAGASRGSGGGGGRTAAKNDDSSSRKTIEEEAPPETNKIMSLESVRWFQKRIDDGEARVDKLKLQIKEATALAEKRLEKIKEFKDKLQLEKDAKESAEKETQEIIFKLEDEVDGWIEKYNQCLAEIPKRYYGDPNKVTDDVIMAKWGRLDYHVTVLAGECLEMTTDQMRATLSDLVDAKIIDLCERKPVLAMFVIHRYIWSTLCHVVFSAEGELWGGSFGKLFIKTIKELRQKSDPTNVVNLELISKIKFKIAKDIEESIPKDERAITAAAEALIHRLSAFVLEGKHDLFIEYAHKIFKKALKLLSTFIGSKAIFSLHFPGKEGDRFDPDRMRVKMTDDWDLDVADLRLDFFVSPSLKKIGSAGGNKFDCSGYIIKGGVVVHVHKESGKDEDEDEEPIVKKEPDDETVVKKDLSEEVIVKTEKLTPPIKMEEDLMPPVRMDEDLAEETEVQLSSVADNKD